jgi:hypothetical protein
MKYAVQVTKNKSAWAPGIFRFRTKKEANQHKVNVLNTGGQASLMRLNVNSQWEYI